MNTTVMTIGSFDLLHYGHINLLARCQALGEVVVGVNSDEFYEKYRGYKPTMNQEVRMKNIHAMGMNTVLNEDNGRTLIEEVKPTYLVIGSDWARKDYLKQLDVTQDELDEWNVSVVYVPYTKEISSSKIKGEK